MEAKDVIDSYSEELKKQIDQMNEEEITALADQIAKLGCAIEEPTDEQARNIVAFFAHESIPPVPLVSGIRALALSSMRGRLISATLAIHIASALDKVPEGFWEIESNDKDSDLIPEIDACNDLASLMFYIERTNLSRRVRRAAAIKATRIATTEEERGKFSRMAEELAPKEKTNGTTESDN